MNVNRPQMIKSDGSIAVKIPSDEVTWFSFLQASRALNSEQGGWNSKEHWVKEGLHRLANEDRPEAFLSKWTEASLNSKSYPLPRKSDFKFADRRDALAKGKRGKSGTPKEGSENELNWNLSRWIQKVFAKALPETHRIATYELPLAAESDGQLKVDVVIFDPSGFVEIIELKKSGKEGQPDSPLMALVETLCYTLQLLRCWTSLSDCLEAEAPGKWPSKLNIENISIVLAAPDYWNNCKPGRNGEREIATTDVAALRMIVKSVEQTIQTQPGLQKPKLTLTLANVEDRGKGGLKAIKIRGIAEILPARSVFGC